MEEFNSREELKKFIKEVYEKDIKGTIGQHDIMHDAIKEFHIDWESVNDTIANSFRGAFQANIQRITGSFSDTVNDGTDYSILVTLQDSSGDDDRILDGGFLITPYEGSVTAANAIPWGSSLSAGDWNRHTSGDFERTDGKTFTVVDYIDNNSGGNHTVNWRIDVRYLGRGTSA